VGLFLHFWMRASVPFEILRQASGPPLTVGLFLQSARRNRLPAIIGPPADQVTSSISSSPLGGKHP
jgi:hypothetical protein